MTGDARKVPSGRLARLGAFGQLAAGVAGGVMAEGARLTQGSFAEIAADPAVQEAYMGSRSWSA